MPRLAFRLAAMLLTFAVGVTLAALWSASTRPLMRASSMEAVHPTQILIDERSHGSGSIACGFINRYRASFTTLASSDGRNFSATTIFYGSPKRAAKEFQKRLKQAAIEIIKRETLLDNDGRRIGEQAIIVFPPHVGLPDSAHAELLWTKGEDFGYVESSSLNNILEYEKTHPR